MNKEKRDAIGKIEIKCEDCKYSSPEWECVYPNHVCDQFIDKVFGIMLPTNSVSGRE